MLWHDFLHEIVNDNLDLIVRVGPNPPDERLTRKTRPGGFLRG